MKTLLSRLSMFTFATLLCIQSVPSAAMEPSSSMSPKTEKNIKIAAGGISLLWMSLPLIGYGLTHAEIYRLNKERRKLVDERNKKLKKIPGVLGADCAANVYDGHVLSGNEKLTDGLCKKATGKELPSELSNKISSFVMGDPRNNELINPTEIRTRRIQATIEKDRKELNKNLKAIKNTHNLLPIIKNVGKTHCITTGLAMIGIGLTHSGANTIASSSNMNYASSAVFFILSTFLGYKIQDHVDKYIIRPLLNPAPAN